MPDHDPAFYVRNAFSHHCNDMIGYAEAWCRAADIDPAAMLVAHVKGNKTRGLRATLVRTALSVPGLMSLFGLGKKTPAIPTPTDPLAPVDPTQPSQTPLLDLLRQLAANRRAVQAEVKRRAVEDDVLAKIEAIVDNPNTEPR